MEDFFDVVSGGLLLGFSVVTVVIAIIATVFALVFWIAIRCIMKKALANVGIQIGWVIFLPYVGDLYLIARLSAGGKLPFFSFNLSPIVPQVWVVASLVSFMFFPFWAKVVVTVLGWFCNGAVYTRIWDLSNGRADGHSSWWGLASAIFKVVLYVKCILMAFSSNEIRSTNNSFERRF